MRAIIKLSENEMAEAVLEYLDNNTEGFRLNEYVGVRVEFVCEPETGLYEAHVSLEEKLTKGENS